MKGLAPAIAFVLLLPGCGGSDEPAEPPSTDNASKLRLELDADGEGEQEPQVETLRCPDPPRPDSDPLCGEVILPSPKDLEAVPPETACTEIYGGPDTLHVSGTLDGKRVDATLTRANGCEIERFDKWTPILGELSPDDKPGGSLEP